MRKISLDTYLTQEETAALEYYSCGGAIDYTILQELPAKKLRHVPFPKAVVCFGGTFLAKAVLDKEWVWTVGFCKKGQFFYTAYAEDLSCLLAGL